MVASTGDTRSTLSWHGEVDTPVSQGQKGHAKEAFCSIGQHFFSAEFSDRLNFGPQNEGLDVVCARWGWHQSKERIRKWRRAGRFIEQASLTTVDNFSKTPPNFHAYRRNSRLQA